MLSNSIESLYSFCTTVALNLKTLTLVLDMLLEVFEVDTLLNLRFVTAMQNLDLTQHLLKKLILYWLEDGSVNHISWSLLWIFDRRLLHIFWHGHDLLLFHNLAVVAALVLHSHAIFVCQFEITQETD